MTPQQPQQHCDHECVCGVLMVGGIEGDRSPCDIIGCKHDTRSRPNTPSPGAPKVKAYPLTDADIAELIDYAEAEDGPACIRSICEKIKARGRS